MPTSSTLRRLSGPRSASSTTWTLGCSYASNSSATIGIVVGWPPRWAVSRFMSEVCSESAPALRASIRRLNSRANSLRRGSVSLIELKLVLLAVLVNVLGGEFAGWLARYRGRARVRAEHAGDEPRQPVLLVLRRVVAADLEALHIRDGHELIDELGQRIDRRAVRSGEHHGPH